MAISTWRRLLWHFYRTPAARAIKWVRRTGMRPAIARRVQIARTLPTDATKSQHAQSLNSDGYAFVTDAIDSEAGRKLSEAALAKLARAKTQVVQQNESHKDFWTRLLDEDMVDGALPTDSPFVAFALQPGVLAILAEAYGELPHLDSVLLTLSRDTGKPLAYSQLWHRDHDDTRVIKLFVYLTDVGSMDDGPFTFIPGPTSDRFGFSLHSHSSDAAVVAKLGSDSGVKSVIAPRLSAFMVETTRCLHMGSRLAPGRERLLYTATYISVPRLFPEPPPRFRLSGAEDAVTRCVLSPR